MNDPGHFTLKDMIFDHNQDPDHHAIESPGLHPLTYRDLRAQILYVVKTLNAMGFHRNDRIAIISPAGPETAVIIISVMAGFTSVPMDPQNKTREYETHFSQLKIKAIIVQKGYQTQATPAAESRNLPVIALKPVPGMAGKFLLEPTVVPDKKKAEFASPSDISHVFLTSGTTSRPKIVPVSQIQSFVLRQRQIQTLNITSTDRCLHLLPYYHGMGIGLPLLGILLAGGTVICTKDFIPSDFFPLLKTYRPTYYIAGPAHHQGILREIKKVPPDELKNNSLRFILSSSALLPTEVREELEALLGVAVIEHFATSETGVISINFPPKRGSVGIPVIEHLKILDENDNSARPYEQGEIVVKGETVFSGYENAPDINKTVFFNGWFRTGDMGYIDDEGYLFLTGRKKEIINKGGEKIAPSEIDEVLLTCPGVRDVMTFTVNDPVLGEDIAAMVVRTEARVTEQELRTYLLDRIAPFKVPRKIYFTDAIPRNPAGKPLRHVGTKRYS
jgi:acyl-CoA synthetase (AMP-forming)/AMP-acid ligase II